MRGVETGAWMFAALMGIGVAAAADPPAALPAPTSAVSPDAPAYQFASDPASASTTRASATDPAARAPRARASAFDAGLIPGRGKLADSLFRAGPEAGSSAGAARASRPAVRLRITPSVGPALAATPAAAPAAAHAPFAPASAVVPVASAASAGAPAAASSVSPALAQAEAAAPPPTIVPAPVHIPGVVAGDAQFPEPAVLKPNVAFWVRVFSEWSEHQSVIHAMDDLTRIYAILDLSDEAERLSGEDFNRLRRARETAAMAHVQDELKKLVAQHGSAEGLDEDAHRILSLFGPDVTVQRLHEAIYQVRAQRGLRERTRAAIEVSGLYLPEMERIFTSYGLPARLTRLPLVESSFNVDAYSKDRAAGLWQFIPAAARAYMRVNSVADDRRDPWASTDAAARHLKDDYDALQDWPLAITAYNFGRGGLARALRDTGGTSLSDLIRSYSASRFGFASRNFYAEFLAAQEVDRHAEHYFPGVRRQAPIRFEQVTTDDYLPFSTLVRLAGTDTDTLRELNPAFDADVISGKLYVPPDTTIRVPSGSASSFRTAYAGLGSSERFSHQRVYWSSYRVRRGDSVKRVARRFGLSEEQLMAANHWSGTRHRLRTGSVLRVPPPDESVVVASKVEANPAKPTRPAREMVASRRAAAAARARCYRVRSGDSLSSIARHLDVSVHRLCAANGLRTHSPIRAGMSLKIPVALR